jgi:hypothetical protein
VTDPAQPGDPRDPGHTGHAGLRAADVLARGGWHASYLRVLAVASDGDYGFALVDGNGDGAELEAEAWLWDSGQWEPGSSSGAGPLDYVGSLQTGGEVGPARFAYGRAPGRQAITVSFEHRQYDVPVSQDGAWAFVKVASDPASCGAPSLAS